MNDRTPRTDGDHVLVDVKAKPSGWPTASLDPDSGRGPQATSGMPANRDPQSQVSSVSGDCRGGLPIGTLGGLVYAGPDVSGSSPVGWCTKSILRWAVVRRCGVGRRACHLL